MNRTRPRHPLVLLPLLTLLAAALACNRGISPEDIPTRVPSIDALATSVKLTENAPPPGFRDGVMLPQVDANLRVLEGWRYDAELSFDGVFSGTSRPATANTVALVYWNQLANARRVTVTSSGELLRQPDGESFEAVQLGPDAFLVRNGACLANAEDDAVTAASLSAGALLGGVRDAFPVGQRRTVNGQEAFEYRFNVEALNLPMMRFAEDTRITQMAGELWVAPEIDAAVRYYVTMDVENARLLANDLPVTGQLRLRYDLFEVGTLPNISVPFGC